MPRWTGGGDLQHRPVTEPREEQVVECCKFLFMKSVPAVDHYIMVAGARERAGTDKSRSVVAGGMPVVAERHFERGPLER